MRALRAAELASVMANGLLVGASLDQSIKQLPARRRIGPVAYAAYARAADGSTNGIAWYAALGVGTAGLTVATAAAAVWARQPGSARAAAVAAGLLSLAHSAATTRAAPIMLSLRTQDDEQVVADGLDRFERWQTVRAALQVATLAAAVTAARPARR
jgi:hypothetical protein